MRALIFPLIYLFIILIVFSCKQKEKQQTLEELSNSILGQWENIIDENDMMSFYEDGSTNAKHLPDIYAAIDSVYPPGYSALSSEVTYQIFEGGQLDIYREITFKYSGKMAEGYPMYDTTRYVIESIEADSMYLRNQNDSIKVFYRFSNY